MTGMPSKEQLAKMRKKLAKVPGSKFIGADAPIGDQIKRDICAELIIYRKEHGLTQRELAQRLDMSEALISKILRYHFQEFTIDRLIRYVDTLGIKFKFKRVA